MRRQAVAHDAEPGFIGFFRYLPKFSCNCFTRGLQVERASSRKIFMMERNRHPERIRAIHPLYNGHFDIVRTSHQPVASGE